MWRNCRATLIVESCNTPVIFAIIVVVVKDFSYNNLCRIYCYCKSLVVWHSKVRLASAICDRHNLYKVSPCIYKVTRVYKFCRTSKFIQKSYCNSSVVAGSHFAKFHCYLFPSIKGKTFAISNAIVNIIGCASIRIIILLIVCNTCYFNIITIKPIYLQFELNNIPIGNITVFYNIVCARSIVVVIQFKLSTVFAHIDNVDAI